MSATQNLKDAIERLRLIVAQVEEENKIFSKPVLNFHFNSLQQYNETKEKEHWHNIIQLLPSSYNQMRTVTLNYENLINIYYARRNHKLAEWHTLCDAIAALPYAKEIILVKD